MNNLVKELINSSEKNVAEQTDMVAQAKQLLSCNDAEERRLLSNLGLDAEINFYEKQNIDLQNKIKHQEFFQKPIVTLEEIKSLCFKYRLYLRKSNLFVGKIPTYLGAALNRFVKEKGIIVGEHSSYTDFYIVAPPKMFSDYVSPGEAIVESAKKLQANYHKMMNPDPILLYKLKDGNFAVVESWGNDFTIVRKAKAVLHSPAMINFLAIVIFYIAIPSLFCAGLWSYIPEWAGIEVFSKSMSGWETGYHFAAIVLSLAFVIIYGVFFLIHPDGLRDALDDYKRAITTKHNWNIGRN